MYCIGKRDCSNHTQLCTIQLNMTVEYAKTSTVDQKIPLKIFFVDTSRAVLPFKKSSRSSGLSRQSFPTEMKSSRRRRMSNKRKKERKKERKEKEDGKKRKRMLAFCAFLEKMPYSYHGPNADLSLNAWFKPNVQ